MGFFLGIAAGGGDQAGADPLTFVCRGSADPVGRCNFVKSASLWACAQMQECTDLELIEEDKADRRRKSARDATLKCRAVARSLPRSRARIDALKVCRAAREQSNRSQDNYTRFNKYKKNRRDQQRNTVINECRKSTLSRDRCAAREARPYCNSVTNSNVCAILERRCQDLLREMTLCLFPGQAVAENDAPEDVAMKPVV